MASPGGKTHKLFQGVQAWRRGQDKKEGKEKPITFKATPKQVTWIEAVLSGLYRFMAIGGGIRGTKSFACISAIILLCRIYPRSRWAIVRKDLPTLRRNVLPTLEKLRVMSGGFVGQLNQSVWTYTCANGSEIILFAEQFQQDPELERWKGLEVNGFDLEEANELNEKSANKAIERAGSYIIPPAEDDPEPKQPPPLVIANFNPCNNWPRKWWWEPWKSNTIKAPYFFLPATLADNPFASEEYKESLKYLPPEEYDRFVKGEWDFVDDPNQLIKSEWIWNARNVEEIDGPWRMGVDVARFGDDASTIAKTKGNRLRKMVTMNKFDTTVVSTKVLNESGDRESPVDGQNVSIDGVGVGGGVVDNCRKAGLPVRDVIAGASPIDRPGQFFKFKNLRSQIWWEAREKFRLGQFSLYLVNSRGEPLPLPERLVGDLAAPQYEISGDKVITVESKDDLKKRLGRSPDEGDALVMAMFDFPAAKPKPVLPGTIIIRGH